MKSSLKLTLFISGLAVVNACASGQTNSIYAWRTLTGRAGGVGNSDGVGATARFWYPSGVARDSGANLYVADTYNNTIRKMTSAGVVSTLAGTPGEYGSADGAGGAARFNDPYSVAVDNAGNVYVADTGNSTVRKVTSGGVVTTLAGSAGLPGSVDGTGSAARFNEPYGIAVDNAGNVYVADAGNSIIRKVTSGGVVTTLAGTSGEFGSADGTGSAAQFYFPAGVAVDNSGNVYVADLDNQLIRKITSGGVVTTLAGKVGEPGSADGTNITAQFFYPSGVAVDGVGNVYVADTYNSTIRKVTSGGIVTTLAGTPGQSGSLDSTGSTAQFYFPSSLTSDSMGNLYVADTYNSTVRKVSSGGTVTTLAGCPAQAGSTDATGSQARFNSPYGLAADTNGNLFVADTISHTIRRVTFGGLVATLAGSPLEAGSTDATNSLARFNSPYGVAAVGAGDLYVADTLNNTIRKVTSSGAVTTLAGIAGQAGSTDGTGGAARFSAPTGVAVDGAGNLYVTDFYSNTVRKVTSAGVVTTLAGSPGQAGSTDGTGNAARLNGPFGVVADAVGTLYLADSANNTIRKVTAAGVVTTLAGSPGQFGSADGTGSAARFFFPAGVALDSVGNLYVADAGNNTIRKVTSGGVVTTLAGSPGLVGSTDGTGSAALFYAPVGLALDSAGNLFVADVQNDTIRKVTSGGVVTTLAGRPGLAGTTDVAAGIERYSGPSGVAVDSTGTLLVADTYNHTIRKVTSDGAVATLAGRAGVPGSGDGIGQSALFSYPNDLAVDNAGNVYVTDSYNNTIRKIAANGTVTTLAGGVGQLGSADGQGSAARFSYPSGIAVDVVGNIYVADSDNATLRKITSGGLVTTLAGSAGQLGSVDGSGSGARFAHPNGVAVDSTGNLFVADSGNSTIRKVTGGGLVTTLAGSAGQSGGTDGTGSAARFDFPVGIAVDGAGDVYVADSGNSTIRKVSSEGVVTTIGGLAGVLGGADGIGSLATFAAPAGIAVDGGGRLYVADTGNNRISRGIRLQALSIAASGRGVLLSWPSPSTGFALQQSSDLGNPNSWSKSTYSVNDDGTNKTVDVSPPAGLQFFRLMAN